MHKKRQKEIMFKTKLIKTYFKICCLKTSVLYHDGASVLDIYHGATMFGFFWTCNMVLWFLEM